jgi:hypothetical protein
MIPFASKGAMGSAELLSTKRFVQTFSSARLDASPQRRRPWVERPGRRPHGRVAQGLEHRGVAGESESRE